ncbi:MAG: hypothetical protein J0L78_04260 [Planctomycetes bacterium]|nr:hypothetical protein [Planctomycetota bacterium]
MSRGVCVFGLAAILGVAAPAFAQFQAATVSVLAKASSSINTGFGGGTLSEEGGAGAYPQFLGSANADQAFGTSGVLARAQLGLEMSETGLSATGSFFVSVTAGEGFILGSASALSRIWVEFTIDSARTWRIDPGMTTGSIGNTVVTLESGSATVFAYSGEFTGATGEIPAGAYRLAIAASAEIVSNGISNETGGTYSVGFALAEDHPCPADLNGDHVVDDFDFLLFLPAYDLLDCADPTMPEGCPADLNGDGVVDDADFLVFLPAYDALVCPTNG